MVDKIKLTSKICLQQLNSDVCLLHRLRPLQICQFCVRISMFQVHLKDLPVKKEKKKGSQYFLSPLPMESVKCS